MSLFNSGLSGLLASQRGLTVAGHNIANVNTEGYSRQRVELVARTVQGSGVSFLDQASIPPATTMATT